MPFTVSHAAAALPLRPLRLIPSAVVAGTFAPDLEYFLRLAPGGGWGHTLAGAFGMSLPMGLAALWLFHGFAKRPAVRLLPDALARRLEPWMGRFTWSGGRRLALVVVSVLMGVFTHLLWDSFTHKNTWLWKHWALLDRGVFPVRGVWILWYELLQMFSSAVGIVVLLIWLWLWYRRTPEVELSEQPLPTRNKLVRAAAMMLAGLVLALFRSLLGVGIPRDHWQQTVFIGKLVVTFMAVLWWWLVATGITGRRLTRAEP